MIETANQDDQYLIGQDHQIQVHLKKIIKEEEVLDHLS